MNTTRKTKGTKPAPVSRSMDMQQFVDIVENTVRDTINTLNNLGTSVRLVADVVLQVSSVLKEKNISISAGLTGSRGMKAAQHADEVIKRVESAVSDD